MATAQSPTTGRAFRIVQPGRVRHTARSPIVLKLFEEQDHQPGADLSPEDCRELLLLEEFLTYHVRQDGFYDVQCMMLWTEWVRTTLRETHRFPYRILEKEFRQAVTDQLSIDITHDEVRGPVYPGIRFVP